MKALEATARRLKLLAEDYMVGYQALSDVGVDLLLIVELAAQMSTDDKALPSAFIRPDVFIPTS